jgi:hypothetical protein
MRNILLIVLYLFFIFILDVALWESELSLNLKALALARLIHGCRPAQLKASFCEVTGDQADEFGLNVNKMDMFDCLGRLDRCLTNYYNSWDD